MRASKGPDAAPAQRQLSTLPVLKHHDVGGSEITGAVKHVYGILSMSDGHSAERHYQGLGAACGKMFASVRPPVLDIIDAIWVSHLALTGYNLSLIHISEPTRLGMISYAVFCLK